MYPTQPTVTAQMPEARKDGFDPTPRPNPFEGIDPDEARRKVAAAIGMEIKAEAPSPEPATLPGVNQFGEPKESPIPEKSFHERFNRLEEGVRVLAAAGIAASV